ncbi:FkbM family methyltransferase [Chryseosolibacter indicus]|uniref:FkbM family methyltransferase n=1 Tax=Chryseosolibacter indicus TaxID=2782351 RepID=A0ABS5VMF4_9BACT|nr:FkbM family methyltransferase [Chryseosolibacter indicus]MBT1702029.1 FkbM family methyltransferase [Chryseosolibacter indicus]
MNFIKAIKGIVRKNDVAHPSKNSVLDKIDELLNEEVNIIFDIGAHHGRFAAQIAARFASAKIYCFEPSPDSFKTLKQNLNLEKFALVQAALSDFTGLADFYINEFDETNSLLPSKTTFSAIDRLTTKKEVISVRVSTVDEYCREQNISALDVLKIDVQGNTLKTLRGAEYLLRTKRIKIIYCEVEFLEIYEGQSLFHDVTLCLQKFGYSLYSLYNIHYDINERISWADALYCINQK